MIRRHCLHALLAMLMVFAARPALAADTITVAASESFRQSLESLAADYEKKGGEKIAFTFAPSAELAQKAQAGEVDILACAQSWANRLDSAGFVRPGTRKDLLGDHMILIGAAGSTLPDDKAGSVPLATLLDGKLLSLADPDKAQTGAYAKQTLVTLGQWDGVAGHLLLTARVRDTLDAVAAGKAYLGMAYQTDLQDRSDVQSLRVFPDEAHPPIAYTFALTKNARPGAEKFLAFLETKQALAAFAKAGFVLLNAP